MDTKTRNILNRMESSGYLPLLRGIAQSMCVPFWWHGLDSQGEYRIHANGTVCFVQTPTRLLAVTARHVFDEYRKAKAVQPNLRCQFGGTTTEPEDRLIAEDEYLDLATFDVSPVLVAAAGASPHASLTWPNLDVVVPDTLICGGYPGSLRVEREETADIPFQWFALAPISVTPENIKLHIDFGNFHQPHVGGSVPNFELGGMSGGPVFRVISKPIERMELVGFIYECQPSLSIALARPCHYITAQGQIARDFH